MRCRWLATLVLGFSAASAGVAAQDVGSDVRPDAATKVVLAELFTGTECPPCAAADVGFDRIIEAYNRQQVAVLEYHIDIPMQDPLSTAETNDRALYYSGTMFRSAPQAYFDGSAGLQSGGPRSAGGQFWRKARGRINTAAEVELVVDLRLRGGLGFESGRLDIRFVPNESLAERDLRLHVVIYRDRVKYTGSNGTSVHRYVVEKMLDGPHGARLSAQETVDLVHKLPRGSMSQADTGVVVFIQDHDSQHVYQARVVEFGAGLPDAVELYNRGAREARSGNFSAAVELFSAAAEIDPDSPRGHGGLGAAYARLGRRTEACEAFERVLEVEPKAVSAHLSLAKMYEAEGKIAQAVTHLDAFLTKAPEHQRADQARAKLQQLRNRS